MWWWFYWKICLFPWYIGHNLSKNWFHLQEPTLWVQPVAKLLGYVCRPLSTCCMRELDRNHKITFLNLKSSTKHRCRTFCRLSWNLHMPLDLDCWHYPKERLSNLSGIASWLPIWYQISSYCFRYQCCWPGWAHRLFHTMFGILVHAVSSCHIIQTPDHKYGHRV